MPEDRKDVFEFSSSGTDLDARDHRYPRIFVCLLKMKRTPLGREDASLGATKTTRY